MSAQAACDHTPKNGTSPAAPQSAKYSDMVPKDDDWYFMMRLSFTFSSNICLDRSCTRKSFKEILKLTAGIILRANYELGSLVNELRVMVKLSNYCMLHELIPDHSYV